jgi:hypothetical protein
MSKITKAAYVRNLLRKDPNTTADAVVETVGGTKQQAHVMLNTQRKKMSILKNRDGTFKRKYRMQSSEPAPAGSLNNPSIVEVHFPITMESDPVNHPEHYKTGGIETIDFIEAKSLGYNLGNVVKYVTRADHKGNRLEDLEKARWYLDREIGNLSEKLATSK